MPKTYHHGDLKTAAIKKAIEIIQKKGDVDFTLREIAKTLKVTHVAVYRHFSSKKDLLSHISEEGHYKLCDLISDKIADIGPIQKKLRMAGKAYIEFAIKNAGYYRCMFHHELRCDHEQRQELKDAAAKAFTVLTEIMDQGLAEKKFIDKDSCTLSGSVWSSLHGFSILFLDGQFEGLIEQEGIEKAIEDHLDLIERSIAIK